MKTKRCQRCKETKIIDEFYSHKLHKDNLSIYCKSCDKYYQHIYRNEHKVETAERRKTYLINNPWYSSYRSSKARCNNKNVESYCFYGGKGIKFKITLQDFRFLWFRDAAYNMECPSIDRINNNGNYELSNCRFIEMRENSRKCRLENNK